MTPVLERIYSELERAGVSEDRISDLQSRAQNCDASPEAEHRRAQLCALWCAGSILPAVLESSLKPLSDLWQSASVDDFLDAADYMDDIDETSAFVFQLMTDLKHSGNAVSAVDNALTAARNAGRVLGRDGVTSAIFELLEEMQ